MILLCSIFLLLIGVLIFSFVRNHYADKKGAKHKIHYTLIQVGNAGWGYEIFADNVLFIKQTQIPCINGEQAFASEKDATAIAKMVVHKIEENQIPFVSKEELKASKISITAVKDL